MISSFQALGRAKASATILEPATEWILQISRRIRAFVCHYVPSVVECLELVIDYTTIAMEEGISFKYMSSSLSIINPSADDGLKVSDHHLVERLYAQKTKWDWKAKQL
ncbi:hypothetical protein PoB_005730700 [Plakobranchus ocellatus]|uniref:Uncharacterized protein n=1 Tax=Plakobranchus ocellatus TaxID=259542 RepID=A0AAV4CHA5_9GAST|nr:hypothetical protein PoB_005730700 [Plakobranchus ocellatus]